MLRAALVTAPLRLFTSSRHGLRAIFGRVGHVNSRMEDFVWNYMPADYMVLANGGGVVLLVRPYPNFYRTITPDTSFHAAWIFSTNARGHT